MPPYKNPPSPSSSPPSPKPNSPIQSQSASAMDDRYRDEDGEPLMDLDEIASDGEDSPVPAARFDDDDEEDWDAPASPAPAPYDEDKVGKSSYDEDKVGRSAPVYDEDKVGRSAPVYDEDKVGRSAPVYDEDKVGKPRKRLVKKGGNESPQPYRGGSPVEGLEDWEDEVEVEEEPSSSKRRKGGEDSGKEKRKSKGDKSSSYVKGSKSGSKSVDAEDGNEDEMQELWDTVGANDSENDEEVVKTVDDDAFIDDSGVDPTNRYGSDNEAEFARNAPQAEEDDDDVSKLFKGGKRKKKAEKSPQELAMIVERLMAELEVTAEEDADLNRQNKPAVNKLKKLPLLTSVLSKKNLQQEFLDHDVLTLLRTWLEPLPDGSFPNMNVRTAILNILHDLPIDLEQIDRKEQLKNSGLGRVIMFLSKSDEETTSNRKLAKELVDKWSRPIFNKSTRYEDMRRFDDERAPDRRPSMKKPVSKAAGLESRDDDLDLGEFSQGQKSSQAASRRFTSRPEALPLDFLVRPQSKIDPEEIRARAKHVVQDQRRLKMNKKLQQLKAPKKKQLQASKPSVEGRGMVKYL